MKILIRGKGGSGKSTIAALLAKSIAAEGYNVLVIDSDESNFGLHRQLGMELPKDFMNYIGGKKAMSKRMMKSIPKGKPVNVFDKTWRIEELARSVKKPVYFVLNKVGDESKDIMLKSLNSNKVAGMILANTDVFRAGLAGEELDVQLSEIEELAKFLFSGQEGSHETE